MLFVFELDIINPIMKRILLFLISLFTGIGLFFWIGKIVGWQEIKNAFLVFTGWKGIIIFILTFLTALIGNWKWREILKWQKVEISFWELFKSYLAGFSVMFLAPVLVWGGEVLRGYILRQKNKVPWPKLMASIFIDRILEWTVNLVIIFLGVLLFLYKIGLPPKNLLIIFGGAFVIFSFGIFYFYFKAFKKESLARFFLKITGLKNFSRSNAIMEAENEVFDFFRLEGKSTRKAFVLSFFRALVMHLRTWILIIFLSKKIDILSALSVLGFTYLAAMIPLPAALGSHEAIQTFAFNSLGLGSSTAAAFTMIIRGAELLLAFLGLAMLFKVGVSFIKNLLFKDTKIIHQ